jgi:hypothetical protein
MRSGRRGKGIKPTKKKQYHRERTLADARQARIDVEPERHEQRTDIERK